MIEQQGRVVCVENDMAEVCLGAATGCARCDAGKGCGAGIFSRLLKRKPVVLSMQNVVGARNGQSVMVGIPESVFLRLVARIYLIPLLSGIAGAAMGRYLSVVAGFSTGGADAMTLLCGFAFGLAALLMSRKDGREFPGMNIVHLLRVVDTHEPGN